MKNNKGSTLIELLIAIAILALITAPFYKSITSAMGINYKSQDEVEANLIAQNGTEEFIAMDKTSVESIFPKPSFLVKNKYEVVEIIEEVDIVNFDYESPESNPIDLDVADFVVNIDYLGQGNPNVPLQHYDGTGNLKVSEMNIITSPDSFTVASEKTIDGTISYAQPSKDEIVGDNFHANDAGADQVVDVESSGKDELEIKPKWLQETFGTEADDYPPYFYMLLSPDEDADFDTSSTVIVLVYMNQSYNNLAHKIDLEDNNNLYKYTITVKRQSNNAVLKTISILDEK